MEEQKPKIVEAIQFNHEDKEWPEGVRPWTMFQPRDMSWGFIDTAFGKAHVLAGDWICKTENGDIILLRYHIYKKLNIQYA
jgi:hypothetical protein